MKEITLNELLALLETHIRRFTASPICSTS